VHTAVEGMHSAADLPGSVMQVQELGLEHLSGI
jgi:hypothetical protein